MKILEDKLGQVKALCENHFVEKLYLFGSGVRNELNEKSDVDLLVRFGRIELSNYFENYLDFKSKLKSLFGREVDLVEEQTLKNPILINSINRDKALIYG
ncbi:MAG: putative nucleotidyltransferase [Flammeovirgaceae bacterium]|jgi:predicted nucleotidyltransferase